ncbi:phosphoribosyltransferase family protein [Halomarina halobia]|uniref:Phosphoribosyltransferase family protein n=1 Tax=Halomarina halobia TaxID=3033386 RepID=A0ABD6A5D4_9EURY|nr:phosphoribosyltransferase family protein [Halomarina sp. PSR21]
MNYRSIAELNSEVRQLAHDLPSDIDLVVGIPRSGLLAANLLCLNLNVPMTDVDGLCEGRLLATGYRYDETSTFSDVDRVLVIDDSVDSGREMTNTRRRLDEHDFPFDVEYAAVYISAEGYQYVDHWGEVVGKPRVFEWNLMHHPMLKNCCVDIDGVLCRDPTRRENDDGENYREFVTTVEPKILPTERVGWLVTCRLEKYRDLTEEWLDAHGVEYDNLVMMDLPSKEVRRARGNHAEYKANVYKSTGANLFIESSHNQAVQISERTGKPVYCYYSNEMVQPDALARTYDRGNEYLSRLVDNPISFPLRASRYLLTRGQHRMNLLTRRYRDD